MAKQRKRAKKSKKKPRAKAALAAPTAEQKRLTGFARLTPEQRKALGARGGTMAAASGKAHRWTEEEARAAGKAGAAARAAAKDDNEAAQ